MHALYQPWLDGTSLLITFMCPLCQTPLQILANQMLTGCPWSRQVYLHTKFCFKGPCLWTPTFKLYVDLPGYLALLVATIPTILSSTLIAGRTCLPFVCLNWLSPCTNTQHATSSCHYRAQKNSSLEYDLQLSGLTILFGHDSFVWNNGYCLLSIKETD